MQSRWAAGYVFAVASLLVGCSQPKTTALSAALSPVPALAPVVNDKEVVPIHLEVVTNGPRIRVCLTALEFDGTQPFPTEAPDLWSTDDEHFRIVNSDEFSTLVDGWKKSVGGIRRTSLPSVDTGSGNTAHFDMEYSGSCRVTSVIAADGSIQLEIVPSKHPENIHSSDPKSATVELSENQSVIIAGPTMLVTSTEISRTPILSDIPVVGPALFSAKKRTTSTNKTLYLVSCEVITQ